ncbi:MAG: (2Fe-2S)-binding protein, partial [Bacteroidetes bacterium HGW-Bacteroidetes-22]
MNDLIKIIIDGKTIQGEPGETILHVANRSG